MANYVFHPTIFLRTPSLGMENLDAEHLSIEELIKRFDKDDFIKKAIFVAAPEFYRQTESRIHKLSNDYLENDKKQKKVLISLYKYFVRSCTKPTPFGLFSSISTGKWNNETLVELNDEITFKSKADYNLAFQLFQLVKENPRIKYDTQIRANKTIYRIGNELRFIDRQYYNNLKNHSISQVIGNDILNQIIEASEKGIAFKELLELLTSKGFSHEESEEYLDTLLMMNILLSEFELNLTGNHPLDYLINLITKKDKTIVNGYTKHIKDLNDKITTLNLKSDFDKNFKEIKGLLGPLKLKDTDLVQIDSYKGSSQNTIDRRLQKGILNGVRLIKAFQNKTSNQDLIAFKDKFYERYGNQEVCILHAIDPEYGIGYPVNQISVATPFIKDVSFLRKNDVLSVKRSGNQRYLQRLLNEAISKGEFNIDLTKKIIEKLDLKKDFDALPDSLIVLFSLLDEKNIIFQSAGSSSAACYLGRFAHLDKEIKSFVKDIYNSEQKLNADKIVAEIIHSPQIKMGNILYRNISRQYEVPILGATSVTEENTLELNDLYLKIQETDLVLFSKKLNKQVIPKLSNAHSFGVGDIPVYKFLCDLQNQDKNFTLNFNWGDDAISYPFLPRLTYDQNIILYPATWNLFSQEILSFKNLNDTDLQNKIKAWREKHNIPLKVNLVENGNELYIDFEKSMAIRVLLDSIKTKNIFTIKEFLFDDYEGVVKSHSKKKHVNEYIATLIREDVNGLQQPFYQSEKHETPRSFSIPSDWMYYKIYCGERTANKLLTQNLLPVIRKMKNDGLIQKWFFIRYRDTDFHLRIRFELTDPNNFDTVNRIFQDILEEAFQLKTVWKIQLENYEREIEKYGNNFIVNAEGLFDADSKITAEFLQNPNNEDDLKQIHFATILTDTLLDDFNLTLENKSEILKRISEEALHKFDLQKEDRNKINLKYRGIKDQFEDTLTKRNYASIFPDTNIGELLKNRSVSNKMYIKDLHDKCVFEQEEILKNLIHMSCNRLFTAEVYKYELLVYAFLQKFYRSKINRK